MLYPCLSAQGLARWGIAAFALGSAVAALAFWLLTPALGLAGAGLAYALAQSCAVAVIVLAYRRRFGFAVAEDPAAATRGCPGAAGDRASRPAPAHGLKISTR